MPVRGGGYLMLALARVGTIAELAAPRTASARVTWGSPGVTDSASSGRSDRRRVWGPFALPRHAWFGLERLGGGAMLSCDTAPREFAMTARRPPEERARLGEAIYEREIRKQVESLYHGAIVAIDVNTGDWVVADTVLGAAELLRAQRPEATDVWSVRVGHRAVYSFAGSSVRRDAG